HEDGREANGHEQYAATKRILLEEVRERTQHKERHQQANHSQRLRHHRRRIERCERLHPTQQPNDQQQLPLHCR
ncbi:MAG: hypothetical protein ACK559_31590, partial [bacterium]